MGFGMHDQKALPILVIGDSHMECVTGQNIWDDCTSVHEIQNRQGIFFLKGRKPRDAEYWLLAAAMSLRHRLLLFWRGSEHYIAFLASSVENEFDFMCEGAPHLPLDRQVQVVPGAMVQEHFNACVAPLSAVLAQLKNAESHCTIIAPPPPKELSDRDLRERMEIFFLAQVLNRGLQLDDVRFSSPILMLKLWHELQRAQRVAAAQHGFQFLPPPPRAVDRDGFLRPEYWRSDITHANERYGTAVLDQLRYA